MGAAMPQVQIRSVESDIEASLNSYEAPQLTSNTPLQSVLDNSRATYPCENASTSDSAALNLDSAAPNPTLRHRCIHTRLYCHQIPTFNLH
jgi:hypothetical protein